MVKKLEFKMVLPVAMMFAGFVLLLGYPAIAGLS